MKQIIILLLILYSSFAIGQNKVTLRPGGIPEGGIEEETDPIVKAIVGIPKSNGSTISTAVAGTDYLAPTGSAAALTSFPTFNQNTTGSAATLTTGRTIGITGDATYTSPSFNGSANVTTTATVTRVNGVAFSGLATGILKNTTTTGVPSIAIAADFPTLNQNTTGSAATWTTGRTIAITGDLTYTSPSLNGSANVTAAGTIANDAVTFAKFQNLTQARLLGRYTASTGDMQEITLGSGLSLNASTGELTSSGAGGAATDLSNLITTSVANTLLFHASETGGVSAPAPYGGSRFNYYDLSALSTNATFAAPSGTPLMNNTIWMVIQDNGSTRTLAWNAIYDEGSDLALPLATIAGEGMELQFRYHTATSKWRLTGRIGGF